MERLLIRAGTIIKGQDLAEVKNGTVLVEDDKISKTYEQVTDVEGLEDAVTMNVGGKTLIPGMIDCHNYLALNARISNHPIKMSDYEVEQTLRAAKAMHDDLYTGVTTTRYLGDRCYIDVTYRQTQREGGLEGSRLVVSGIGIRSPHGYGCVGMSYYGVEDFRETSRKNIARGVDFLKVFMTKMINVMPFVYHFITPEKLRAVVEEAKGVDITTACCHSGGQRLGDCLTAGIGCLEHVYHITRGQVERIKKMNRWVMYTSNYVLNDDLLLKLLPHDKEESLREREIICGCLSEAIAGELKFEIGTDRLHDGLAREAQCIAQLGVSNRNVLAGVTIRAAKLCGVDQITGTTKEGLAADLVTVDDNPLESIKALSRVEYVIQGGDVVRQ